MNQIEVAKAVERSRATWRMACDRPMEGMAVPLATKPAISNRQVIVQIETILSQRSSPRQNPQLNVSITATMPARPSRTNHHGHPDIAGSENTT